ncbi:MAG: uroporphyrinogen-III synthase [Bacteroidales bacterium]|nr:uroporphyrinogen-III synthase [Bacteroidales bacterium]
MTQILSTRFINAADKSQAGERGVQIWDFELLKIVYTEDKTVAETIETARIPVVFTSRHAVKAISGLIGEDRLRKQQKKCFCIHGATREQALQSGFEVIGEAPDGSGLASEIIRSGCKEVLFLSSDLRRDELTDQLQQAGVRVKEQKVYFKSPMPVKIEIPYEGVMFFSPSQVDIFLQCNPLHVNMPAFCIGKTTADHLQKKGHKNILIAEKSSTAFVLKKVFEYYHK